MRGFRTWLWVFLVLVLASCAMASDWEMTVPAKEGLQAEEEAAALEWQLEEEGEDLFTSAVNWAEEEADSFSSDPFGAGQADAFPLPEEEVPQLAGEVADEPEEDCGKGLPIVSLSEIDPEKITINCQVYDGTNLERQSYNSGSAPVTSALFVLPDRRLLRVQAGALEGRLLAEYYDASFNILETREVPLSLPLYGGFYYTQDYYYLVTGQENPDQDDALPVIRLSKYDSSWNLLAEADLCGANTTKPFSAGSVRFAAKDNILVVRTCHRMYASSDGTRHQANLELVYDVDAMTIRECYFKVGNSRYGYVSHSFNQFVLAEGNEVIALDHGDAYPRSLYFTKRNLAEGFTDSTSGSWFSRNTLGIPVLSFPGG